MTEETIEASLAKIRLAKKTVVAVRALRFIGTTNCDHIKKGAKLFQYNLVLKGHPKHRSTLAEKEGWE